MHISSSLVEIFRIIHVPGDWKSGSVCTGSYGIVYKARHKLSEMIVALKRVKQKLYTSASETLPSVLIVFPLKSLEFFLHLCSID